MRPRGGSARARRRRQRPPRSPYDDDARTLNGSEDTLPFTGFDPAPLAAGGLLLAVAGIGLRRRLRPAACAAPAPRA